MRFMHNCVKRRQMHIPILGVLKRVIQTAEGSLLSYTVIWLPI